MKTTIRILLLSLAMAWPASAQFYKFVQADESSLVVAKPEGFWAANFAAAWTAWGMTNNGVPFFDGTGVRPFTIGQGLSTNSAALSIDLDTITSGTLADARIASTLMRDDEAAALYLPLSGGTLAGALQVPADAYDEASWNGSLQVPTKDAIRDVIETLGAGDGSVTSVDVSVPTGLAASGGPVTGSGTIALSWSGKIPDSSLNTNVARLNQAQTWTAPQDVNQINAGAIAFTGSKAAARTALGLVDSQFTTNGLPFGLLGDGMIYDGTNWVARNPHLFTVFEDYFLGDNSTADFAYVSIVNGGGTANGVDTDDPSIVGKIAITAGTGSTTAYTLRTTRDDAIMIGSSAKASFGGRFRLLSDPTDASNPFKFGIGFPRKTAAAEPTDNLSLLMWTNVVAIQATDNSTTTIANSPTYQVVTNVWQDFHAVMDPAAGKTVLYMGTNYWQMIANPVVTNDVVPVGRTLPIGYFVQRISGNTAVCSVEIDSLYAVISSARP